MVLLSSVGILKILVNSRNQLLKKETFLNKKLFRGAILETVLLNLINDAPRGGLHGYAIFMAIHKKFGVRLGPSTLYPELKLLEKQALIESSWDLDAGKARRQYRITRKGQTLLKEYYAELKVVIPSFVSCTP
jgi:DNA-binding PadR family transcriptional regulator